MNETLEQAAEKYVDTKHKPAAGTPNKGIQNFYDCRTAFKDGAKWQQERSCSEVFEWLASKDYLSDKVETIQKEFKNFKNKNK